MGFDISWALGSALLGRRWLGLVTGISHLNLDSGKAVATLGSGSRRLSLFCLTDGNDQEEVKAQVHEAVPKVLDKQN
jgi:hypothetical protein